MASERTHAPDDAVAEAASELSAGAPPALAGLLGNRALGRLARAGMPAEAATNAVTGNRARARFLGRIIHEDEDISRPEEQYYSPKSSALRDAIIENAKSLVDSTEGELKFYYGVDKDSIESGRKWAAGRGTTYTDCIDFAGRRLGVGLQKIKKRAAVPSPVFPDNHKAFVRAYQGMPPGVRPSPGDIFVMHKRKPDGSDSGDFAHTGVIGDVDQSSTPERWTSYDGGQGSAVKLQHLQKTRDYDPDTNVFGGNWLYGWIDVDLV